MSTLCKNAQVGLLLFIMLLAMLQGWGDSHDFLRHPARAGLAAAFILSVLLLLFVPCPLLVSGTREIRRQRWGTFLALGAVGGLCWFLPYADRRAVLVWEEHGGLRYLGLTCAVMGIGIRIGGMAQLGNLFSGFVVIQPDHRLVTNGWYRWVRHPIYAGSLLAFAGLFLVFRSWLIVLALPLYVLGTLWRIRDEERLLAETFGEAYTRYKARTWCVIPFLY